VNGTRQDFNLAATNLRKSIGVVLDCDAAKPLNRWEKCGLVFLLFIFIALGGMVEYRSAFLTRRMGDLDVFFARRVGRAQ